MPTTMASARVQKRTLQPRGGRLALFTIVAAVLATTWGPAAPTAIAATPDLRVALPMAEDGSFEVKAASGTAILADAHDGFRLSQDSGATWVPAKVPADWSPYFRHVEDGKAVSLEQDWGAGTRTVRVFSLAANAIQDFAVSIDLQAYSSTTGVGFIPGAWVSVDLATRALTDLEVEEPEVAGGFEADSTFVMGEAMSAVRVTTSRNQLTYAWGDGYLDVVPLSGGAGPAPVLVPGLAEVKVVGDEVVYTSGTTSALAVCRRALTMATPASCTTVAHGDYSTSWTQLSASDTWAVVRVDVEAGELSWLVEGATSVPLTTSAVGWGFVAEGSDPVRPLVAVDTTTGSSIHRVNSDGSTSRLFGYPPAPASPRSLALTPTTVAGEDNRPGGVDPWGQGWSRSITGAGLGAETLLPARASSVMASAGRLFANTANGAQVFDRGVLRVTLPLDEGRWRQGRLSGPYLKSTGYSVVHKTVAGGTIDSSARDIFGSLALEEVDAQAGRWRVRDVAVPAVASVEFTLPDPYKGAWMPRLWGDWVAFGFSSDGGQQGTVVFNYRTQEVKSINSDFPLDLGDGFVLLSNDDVWNFRSGQRITLGGVNGPVATDGVHRVAFATASELVVRTLEGTGASAPRVLGTLVADSDLGVGEMWSPEIDVTKPLNAGSIVIRAGSATVRTLPVPASADGSIRGVSWDAKDSAGVRVPAGAYTYELVAQAADGTGPVKAVDGIGVAGGSITVSGGAIVPVTPVVSDSTPVVDQVLSVNPGVWGPAPVSLAFQWYRRDAAGVVSAVSGARGSSYKVSAADVGSTLRVRVVGSKSGFAAVVRYSAYTSAVAKAQFVTAPTPTISGTARVSMTLTATAGSWSPAATVKFQWYRVSSAGVSAAISGASGSSYQAVAADRGFRLRVRVVGSRPGYVSVVKYSALTATVQPPMVGVTPTISDTTPRVDQRLTATAGVWSPSDVVVAYQWYARNSAGVSTAISGATSSTYLVNGRYAGYTLRVRVVGSKTGYASVVKYSAYTSVVAKATFRTAPTPTISGTARVGSTLTVNRGAWSPAPSSFRYQWYRSGAAITGATSASYVVVSADRGTTLTVKVTAYRTGYVTTSRTSAGTAAIS